MDSGIELLEPGKNPQKDNMLMYILMIPVTVLKYSLVGLKLTTYDLLINLYNALSWNLDKTYRTTKDAINPEDIYERTKGSKKKEKTYNYSNATLKKLEKEKELLLKDLQTAGATRSKTINAYYFKVREKTGKIITGTMNGLSKLDINAFLLNEGYDVYVIKTSKWINFAYKDSTLLGSTKMTTKELIFFITQLSTYLKAGLTLSNSVKILSKQMTKNKAKARAFQSISYELTLGESFSTSMEKQENMFPPLLINMIKAAEASGTLIETLEDMANYYTELNATKKQMLSAVSYPAIILVFAVVVVGFILIYVVPQFTAIYEENNAAIGGLTLFVINSSAFLSKNILFILFGMVLFVIILIMLYKKVKSFRTLFQMFLMKLPIIKNIIIYNELTIFAKTFASLLRNNVFITESMSILSKITNNEIYKAILYKTINNIVRGEKISEAFEGHWAVPDVAYFMIVTGESTGELDDMMQKVSDYYQENHKSVVNNLKTLIEPILTAFLAVVVGLIIIAVIVPMYGVYDTLQ